MVSGRARRLYVVDASAAIEISTLSLHDALPISQMRERAVLRQGRGVEAERRDGAVENASRRERLEVINPARVDAASPAQRSEEHTSELQSHSDLVCRLLLEKKKKVHNAD